MTGSRCASLIPGTGPGAAVASVTTSTSHRPGRRTASGGLAPRRLPLLTGIPVASLPRPSRRAPAPDRTAGAHQSRPFQRQAAAVDLETDKPLLQPTRRVVGERSAAEEVVLVQLDHPAETCAIRR